ncbi:glycosyltransferase family 4 protein [Methylocystis heyeri]|uniref:Glycosyltransferase n=1 Tax=Methylocystis heyeri TaxID=391905 RepID=A0A6B8KLG0_9HYPH|nr:glycosyltransferase family 4 protein [Methylocystis heyeri]QGM47628.1 glycosyltransferase [Methylocystis heyeri]
MLKFRDSPARNSPDRLLAGRTVMQIIPDLNSGGAERSAIEIAEALAQAGARSLVASRGGRMVSELQSKGGLWLPFPAATKNPLSMFLNSVRLARLLSEEGVAILHARSRAPAWTAYYAARRAGARFVTTYHSAYSGSSPIKLRYNSIMASGDIVIANSEFIARRIAELHPEAKHRIAVVPRGVDLRQFSPDAVEPERVEKLRIEWGVEPHHRVLLLPARLTARKGHFLLIEAARKLVAKGLADIRFVFAGDARSEAFKRDILQRIERLGLSNYVRAPGHCADMPAAYLAAAVVVAPSIEPEAFGRVAVEAQAMGVPVIVSDIGAAAEVVLAPPEASLPNATGRRVPANDAEALAEAIEETLGLKASEREALSFRARAFVTERYSIERMRQATMGLYERLLEGD